jgi:hypothetical protein
MLESLDYRRIKFPDNYHKRGCRPGRAQKQQRTSYPQTAVRAPKTTVLLFKPATQFVSPDLNASLTSTYDVDFDMSLSKQTPVPRLSNAAKVAMLFARPLVEEHEVEVDIEERHPSDAIVVPPTVRQSLPPPNRRLPQT